MTTVIWPTELDQFSKQTLDANFERSPAKPSSGEEIPPIEGEATQAILCPTGDVLVKLTYGNKIDHYLVLSQVLSLISPVWRKSLDPDAPFKKETMEYNGTEVTVLNLEDDDEKFLAMILRCSHFQMDTIPSTLSFSDLKSLAVVCDKYDCAKIFKPWFDSWRAPWESTLLLPGHEDWLFISKVFGTTKYVPELISQLVENSSSLSECESYIKRGEREVPVELILNYVKNEIKIEREKRIETMILKLRNLLKGFLDGSGETKGWCSDEVCQSLIYGSFLRSIRNSGLWELLKGDQVWHGTLNELKKRFATITYMTTGEAAVASRFVCTAPHRPNRWGVIESQHSCRFETDKCRLLSTLRP